MDIDSDIVAMDARVRGKIASLYESFLARKAANPAPIGKTISAGDVHEMLFPFQRDIVKWACRKGCAAIFADTGLGKTLMQLEWARLMCERTLIVAPLSVARQTQKEAEKVGIEVVYAREQSTAGHITITNYEMVEKFNPADFGAIVLDESSILKSLAGRTRTMLIEMFQDVPYRLCCTATPAPNDIGEIANHAHFLGIMTRAEMLAMFFVHDASGAKGTPGNSWRLKMHAEDDFYSWLASWGMSIRKPSDLGYSDEGYNLPPLTIKPHFIDSGYVPEGRLFFAGLKGIQDRSAVRRGTIAQRTAHAIKLVKADSYQWIVWCGMNDKSSAIVRGLPDAVEVKGSDSVEHKIAAIQAFQDGEKRVLVTKPRIAGFGMNFQNACKMAFVGLSDSWEAYYQCIRREWRFGQTNPVDVHVVLTDVERAIYRNVARKEKEAEKMSAKLIERIADHEKTELGGNTITEEPYITEDAKGEGWRMMLGDSSERLAEVEDESVGLSVFSPPFSSLYTYSASRRDLGNSKDDTTFWEHFRYIIKHLYRTTMPGRNCAVHVADIGTTKAADGVTGLKDFPGHTIQAFVDEGWVYHGRVAIDKNPQSQAIRTKSKSLLFVQLHKDSSWSRPALADYVVIFRKPGENTIPIKPDVDNETWIKWAHPIWYDINETDTLKYRDARDEKDERHICPLQLGTIQRCVRLWSNPGELILSPFAGIGSEGYVALKHGRRFIGCELKASYYNIAVRNLKRVVEESKGLDLFAGTTT